MKHTIEIALDLGAGALASVYVELDDGNYSTAKRFARGVSHAVAFRSVDAAAEPVSPWMYFGRAHSAIRFRLQYPDRMAEVPDDASRIVLTRTDRIVALSEYDQAVED